MIDDARMKVIADWLNIRPSYVVLGRQSNGTCVGIIENSFSMDLSEERINIFWSSEAARDNIVGALHVINGAEDAERYRKEFQGNHKDISFSVFDLHDPECPIDIEWEGYLDSHTPAETLSGVKNKFGARNPKFYVKDE